jgi:protoporphyrinogen/coproporphyrinogen III oxidase
VVGGGIAGLTAAWGLRGCDVLVLEREHRLGGRIRSEPRAPYWLNVGAHVFGGPGSATGRLLEEAGVEAVPVPGHLAAVELRGKVVAGGRPELFPLRLPLSLSERLALVRVGARLRVAVARYARNATPLPGEPPFETGRRVLAYGDDRTFADWLGEVPPVVEAIFRTTVGRSTAEPSELAFGHGAGYFALVWKAGKGLSSNILGGASRLIEALANGLNGRILEGAEVRDVRVDGDVVRLRVADVTGERELCALHVVLACKAFEAAALVSRGLPADTLTALEAIPYGPTVVMGMITGERGPMPWDDLYALATPTRSFNMLFNAANVLRPRSAVREPGGSLTVSRPGHAALALFERTDTEIEQTFLDDLYAIYPQARGIVRETLLVRMPRMLPYVAPGRAALQPALEQQLGRLHLAGDYLGSTYTETAVQTGHAAALAIRSALAIEQHSPTTTPAAAR